MPRTVVLSILYVLTNLIFTIMLGQGNFYYPRMESVMTAKPLDRSHPASI